MHDSLIYPRRAILRGIMGFVSGTPDFERAALTEAGNPQLGRPNKPGGLSNSFSQSCQHRCGFRKVT